MAKKKSNGKTVIDEGLLRVNFEKLIEFSSVPIKQGHWEESVTAVIMNWEFRYECSECGQLNYERSRYCPHCGAMMGV